MLCHHEDLFLLFLNSCAMFSIRDVLESMHPGHQREDCRSVFFGSKLLKLGKIRRMKILQVLKLLFVHVHFLFLFLFNILLFDQLSCLSAAIAVANTTIELRNNVCPIRGSIKSSIVVTSAPLPFPSEAIHQLFVFFFPQK